MNRVASCGSSLDGYFSCGSHSRELGLTALREQMVLKGDLTSTVVRIESPFGRPIEEIYDGVHDGPVLGTGVSGLVRLVKHRATGVKYAIKILDIGLLDTDERILQLQEEILIMCELDHPNIVRIEEVYESHNEIYIVQELCLGGDLFDRLEAQPDYCFSEEQCAMLVKQMLCAIRYLHSKGIIHRDLKLENFLFTGKSLNSGLKMIDFGLSKHFDPGQHHYERVGTPYMVAPEILQGDYDERCDMWALGVITYLLMCGETPFGGLDGEDLMEVRSNILRGELLFEPADVWGMISREGKMFVQQLLNCNPAMRPTAQEAQKTGWIDSWKQRMAGKRNCELSIKTLSGLMKFKKCPHMKRLLSEVLSYTLLPEQIIELREEFDKMDHEGNGEISLNEMKLVVKNNSNCMKLGGLDESEIEEIFEAVRFHKQNQNIRWHEFLAAELSQARVDCRNMRLAFDRLDTERKGFITLDDVVDVLGNCTDYQEIECIWAECLESLHISRVTYSDFVHLIQGQAEHSAPVSPQVLLTRPNLLQHTISPSPALLQITSLR